MAKTKSTKGAKKRYAQVGIGGRGRKFTEAITEAFKDCSELVGFCDVNQGRMDMRNKGLAEKGIKPVPTYRANEFDRMIAETKPDVVIVTTVDATHSQYICRAMELGCDVVTEKPMTTDEAKCRRILQTAAKTGRNCQVTFNYRYSPPRSQVREMIADGAIGDVLSVDFCWLLDTRHGADYFHRWHSNRENSGSLLVHKATHHFDLVNWWIDDIPEEVFCHGSLRYYTPQMGDSLGLQGRAERCLVCPVKGKCKFNFEMVGIDKIYLDNEHEDGYFRDQCVFRSSINIWDSMSVAVRYKKGALLNYMLNTYAPYEGYSIAFNGTKGRLEHRACENTYTDGEGTVPAEFEKGLHTTTLIPEFSKPQIIEVRTGKGSHGGGDPILLGDIFSPNPPKDPLRRKASQRDGAYSILVGVAAYHSIDTGNAISIPELLGDAPI
jgi:predicted dehydrogenase